jgi:hypothetical protein
MSRAFIGAVVVFGVCVCVGSLTAETIRGKVKSVDPKGATLTVTVGNKDREFKISEETKVTNIAGKSVPDRLKDKQFKEGAQVIITTEEKAGKEAVTEVRLARPERKR